MTRRSSLMLASLVGASLMFISGSRAMAQDALGGGDALDRNLGVGTGGRNAARPADPYAARNAVVTGEVVGGREFRDRVGYTSPTDFRGITGSDSIFRFQADSALSGLSSIIGSSTYDQLRFGQAMGGVLALQRNAAGATPLDLGPSAGPVPIGQLAESRLRFDGAMLNATSDNRLTTSVQPTTLGTALSTEGQQVAISASSVRGLTLDAYNERWANLGLTTYDQARMRDEAAAAANQIPGMNTTASQVPGTPGVPPVGQANPLEKTKPGAESNNAAGKVGAKFETRFEDVRTDARPDTSATSDARVSGSMQADYAKVLQRIVDRYAEAGPHDIKIDPALVKELQKQYQQLQNQLGGKAPPAPQIDPATGRPLPQPAPSNGQPQAPTTLNPNQPGNRANPNAPQNTQQPAKSTDADLTKPAGAAEEPKPLDLSKLGPVLHHGEKVEHLSSQEQGRFNELMLGAEDALKKSDYMIAEQRFQRALRFSPGNPMAMAGAANSQLGAGLYLSSALTLRNMFTDHPEMIDVTYAEGLVPPHDRLDEAAKALRARLESPTDRAAYALLLAYVGRQSGDKAMITEGIEAMEKESASDPLAPLLRSIWLAPPDASSKPATPEK